MIVAIVAVTREALLDAWVLLLRLCKFVTGVCRNHERIFEVVPEVWWQLSLAIPRIQCHHRLFILLLHRWHVVVYLELDI